MRCGPDRCPRHREPPQPELPGRTSLLGPVAVARAIPKAAEDRWVQAAAGVPDSVVALAVGTAVSAATAAARGIKRVCVGPESDLASAPTSTLSTAMSAHAATGGVLATNAGHFTGRAPPGRRLCMPRGRLCPMARTVLPHRHVSRAVRRVEVALTNSRDYSLTHCGSTWILSQTVSPAPEGGPRVRRGRGPSG